MTGLLLIRHAATAWNAAGRIQGRTDIPLSAVGRAQAETWRVPDTFAAWDWVASPLLRARETAALMGAEPPKVDALVEMDWGEWEGRTLRELRDELGSAMAANEDRGLDFRPPGGESPRDVQHRVSAWTARIAASDRPTVAVTHKGVIRAVYAWAVGWDMLGKPPQKLHNGTAHHFALDAAGTPRPVELNISLGDTP